MRDGRSELADKCMANSLLQLANCSRRLARRRNAHGQMETRRRNARPQTERPDRGQGQTAPPAAVLDLWTTRPEAVLLTHFHAARRCNARLHDQKRPGRERPKSRPETGSIS